MFEREMETSAAPHVVVDSCLGSLRVRGEEGRTVRLLVEKREDEVRMEREGETISLTIPADGMLICPPGSTLSLERVLGNLRVDGVGGDLAVGTVHGNLALTDVGPGTLGEVLGNLLARDVAGELQSGDVRGNAKLDAVEGKLSLRRVAGNLLGEDLRGGLEAEKVRGNVRLRTRFAAGATYRLDASGNLDLMMEPDANVSLTLRARGHTRSQMPALTLQETDGEVRATLGTGAAVVEADVRGNVMVRPVDVGVAFETEMGVEELGATIERRVNETMAGWAARLESSLERLDADPIRRRVEEAAERARRQAERAAEQARMRAESAERRWQRASGETPRTKAPEATDEERLRVLRMVEEGRLTPDQAAELLAALEGS